MKPLVLTSIEDETGDRCVDILQLDEGRFTYRECRRDPEDGHGWRHLSGAILTTFDTAAAARQAAGEEVAWLKDDSRDRT